MYINYFRSASEGNADEQKPEHTGSHVVVTAGTHELTVADIHLISNPGISDKVYFQVWHAFLTPTHTIKYYSCQY